MVPLTEEAGLVEWVPNTTGLRHCLTASGATSAAAALCQPLSQASCALPGGPPRQPRAACALYFHPCLKLRVGLLGRGRAEFPFTATISQ